MSDGVHRWLKRRSARERNICDKRIKSNNNNNNNNRAQRG
jgi:hypothetical protein